VANGDEVIAPLNKLIKEFLDRGEPVFKSRTGIRPQPNILFRTVGSGRFIVFRTRPARVSCGTPQTRHYRHFKRNR